MQGSVEDNPRPRPHPHPQGLAKDSSTKVAPVVRAGRGGHQVQNTDTLPHPKPRAQL